MMLWVTRTRSAPIRMRKLLEVICMAVLVAMLAACASAGKPAATAATLATDTVASNAAAAAPATVVTVQLDAPAFAPDKVTVAIHLPPGYDATSAIRYPVLYVNDGQDAAAVGLADTLTQLYDEEAIDRIIVVAIKMLPDRMGTYGLSDRGAQRSIAGDSRFGPVGARAHAYSEWVAKTLVPYVDASYRTNATPASRAVLGWSLGALNAFNLGWQYPEVFGTVGAFSPSFWLAADRSDATHVQHTRLAQRMVDAGPKREGLRMWFAVGTAEETDDRDGDGVVDAVDDVRDLIDGYRDDGFMAQGTAAARLFDQCRLRRTSIAQRRCRIAAARRRATQPGQLAAHAAEIPGLGLRPTRAASRRDGNARKPRGLPIAPRRSAQGAGVAAARLRAGRQPALSRRLHAGRPEPVRSEAVVRLAWTGRSTKP